MSFKKIYVLLFIFCFSISSYAEIFGKSVSIGGTSIDIAAPSGFHINEEAWLDDFYASVFEVQPSMKYLSSAVSSDPENNKNRYIIFATFKPLEDQFLSQNIFDKVRDLMLEKQNTLFQEMKHQTGENNKKIQQKIKGKYQIEVDVDIYDQTSLGLFLNKKKAFSIASTVDAKLDIEGDVDNTPQVQTLSYIRLKNKILYVYVFSDYTGHEDLTWIKAKTRELVDLNLDEDLKKNVLKRIKSKVSADKDNKSSFALSVDLCNSVVVSEINKQTPMRINKDNVLLNALCYENKGGTWLGYYYEVAFSVLDEEGTRSKVVNKWCTDSDTRLLLDSVSGIKFNYNNSQGERVGGFEIDSSMCKQ